MRIDSLEAEVVHQAQDTARANELLHLSFHYLYNDTLRAHYYANSAVSLSGKLHYYLGQIVGLVRIGDLYVQRNDYKEAYVHYMEADRIGRDHAVKKGLSILYNALGSFYTGLQKFDQALEYFQRGLQVAPEDDIAGRCRFYLNIGVTYGWSGDYPKAREYLNDARTICSEADDQSILAFIYSNLGNVCYEEKNLAQAAAYFKKAMGLAKTFKNDALLASDHRYMAEVYLDQGILPKARQEAQAALALAGQGGFTDDYIGGQILLGRIFAREHRFLESDTLLTELSRQQTLGIAQQKELLAALVEVNQEKGDYEMALNSSRRLAAVKDSITRLANRQNMDLLEVRFQTRRKEAQIGLLQAQNRWKTFLAYAGGIGLVLCVLIILLLIHSRKLKEKVYQHQQKTLQEENHKIMAEKALMEEKALRTREELDHRNRELSASVMQTDHMTKLLRELKQRLSEKSKEPGSGNLDDIQRLIRHNLALNEDWQRFKLHFEAVHPHFFDQLMKLSPQLSKNELKHCAYIRMNMSNKQVAGLLNVHPDSVKMSRYRIKKKLNLSPQDDLITYILSL
jgi:tetratricopeptide (TPR) repeat protein/DNA-binding CsgD family transcriptional regulator